MSIASVTYSHVFGVNTDIRQNICYVDETTVIYSAGCNVVVSNTEIKTQKLVRVAGTGISGISISADRHVFAVAERAGKVVVEDQDSNEEETERGLRPGLVIYDVHTLRKRRSVVAADGCLSKEFTSLSFSSDTKYLAAQTSAPDYLLHFYVWEKGKLLAASCSSPDGIPIRQIGVNPVDGTVVGVLTEEKMRLFRYKEGGFDVETIGGVEGLTLTSFAWLPPVPTRLALATTTSSILILNTSTSTILQTLSFPTQPRSLLTLPHGFVAGGTSGALQVYGRYSEEEGEKAEERVAYRLVRKVGVPEDADVRSIGGSPAEGIVMVVTEGNMVWRIGLMEAHSGKPEDTKPHPMTPPNHHGPITSLDTCIRKPILATCSSDRSIRIWNYLTNTCELVKHFTEEPLSVALHPSGLFLLVGFGDKLRLMTVLSDDLRVVREFPVRGCRECRFSSGGHLFAATHTNTILIFSTWTFETISTLKGHNGRVRSLVWSQDDIYLVSSGVDGGVYTWDVAELKRDGEYVLKNVGYTSAVVSRDGKTVWVVGGDGLLKEITESMVTLEIQSDQVLTQLVLSTSGRMLFAGTSTGQIRAIKFPLTNNPEDYQAHIAHSGPITKLRLSYDDQFLFSVSEDGTVYVYRVAEREERGLRREKINYHSDEILITKSDLEEKTLATSELSRLLTDLQTEHEYQLRLRDMNFAEKLKEITERYTGEIEALKISTHSMRLEKEKATARFEEGYGKLVERDGAILHDLEARYNQELMAQYEKYQAAQEHLQEIQQRWEGNIRAHEEDMQKVLTIAQAEWEGKLNTKVTEIEKLRTKLQNLHREHTEELLQTTQDIDTEIQHLHTTYANKFQLEHDDSARLKGENSIMRKKFATLTKDIDDSKSEITRLHGTQARLQGNINELEREITFLKREMTERDAVIQDKERRVYGLKKKNQELEKFKFVLDYRIKELKEQVEPREEHIAEMTAHIKQINTALETLAIHEQKFKEQIEFLTEKLGDTRAEYSTAHRRSQNIEHAIKSFKIDLQGVIDYIQDPAVLTTAMQRLANKYLTNEERDGLVFQGIETDIVAEWKRQEGVLRERIKGLRGEVEKGGKRGGGDEVGANRALIKEINRLRQMTRQSERQIKNLKVLAITEVPRKVVSKSPLIPVALLDSTGPSDAAGDKLPLIVGSRPVGVSQ